MKPSTTLKNIYEEVTDNVIAALEKGEIIWRKSWNELGLPKNITTGKPYRGWNVFWLNFHTFLNDYETPFYLTFKQARMLGGSIKKGEKGTKITFWTTVEDNKVLISIVDQATGITYQKHPEKLFPTMHTVFNLEQTEGIFFRKVDALFRSDAQKIEACEEVIRLMPLKPLINHRGDRAYYNTASDQVTMPDARLFHSDSEYYSTLFHELGHATGHKKRLSRKELLEHDGFGGEQYSKEELTAEFTAAFLCAVTGIKQATLSNSTAYIQGWLKALQNDKKLLFSAAAQAQKAADYILSKEALE